MVPVKVHFEAAFGTLAGVKRAMVAITDGQLQAKATHDLPSAHAE